MYAANALALAAAAAAAADGVSGRAAPPHLRPSARRKLPTADDEAWLKHVWRMKPHWSPKEVSNASWAFLSERQISRGIVSRGDPVRLQCLAEKLLGGGAARLNVVGGSVSFGTTS